MKAKPLKIALKVSLYLLINILVLNCSDMSPKLNETISLDKVAIDEDFKSVSRENGTTSFEIKSISPEIPQNLKIIKSAKVKYQVKNVKTATKQIKKAVSSYGTYISEMRFENNLYRKENRFTIKIPHTHFDSAMDSISTFSEFIDYENISTQDVTTEYVDLEARLKTKLEVKQRYESILRKNAITVEDILATEDKLRIIQEEIEVTQGRLKYLTNKVAFSTIQIDLYETVNYKEEPSTYNKTFWTKTKNALSSGWHMIEILFLGILHIWPLVITGTILFIFIKNRLKKK